jgi:hypothetical protein
LNFALIGCLLANGLLPRIEAGKYYAVALERKEK